MAALASVDPRALRPAYSQAEAARILGEHPNTLRRWARGYRTSSGQVQPALISGVSDGRISVPFMALAEARVVRMLRDVGVSMPRIRRYIPQLRAKMGVKFALASERLKTDGTVVLWDLMQHDDNLEPGETSLIDLDGDQGVFLETVAERLQTITYGAGYAEELHLRRGEVPVLITPRRNFGQPTIDGTGVRVEDVSSRLAAGESPVFVAEDYSLPVRTVEALLHAAA